jgi:hypothetical protein
MQDLDSETVIAAFLLETLGGEDRERVLARLEEDEAYFERVTAFESDLILQWHRGGLSSRERELFAKAYATPARRRLVEQSALLIHVADMAAPKNGLAAWLSAPWTLPRWAAAAAVLAMAAAFIAGDWFGARRPRLPDDPIVAGSGGVMTFAMNLTATGEKGPAAAQGFDTVPLPPTTAFVQLTVETSVAPDGPLTAEIVAKDRPIVLRAGTPVIGRSATGTTLTVTVPAADLPDGDYVLTIRGAGARAAGASAIAMQGFRVIRQAAPPR